MTNVSFQLYSARNFPPIGDTLALLGSLGYKEVEGYGGLYSSVDEDGLDKLKNELDVNGLKMATSHFDITQIENEPERVLAIAKTLGIGSIYAPAPAQDNWPKDASQWDAFGARLEVASRPFKDAGLEFGWHNHGFEFEALPDGSLPHDRMFATAPSLSWEIDVAWVIRGGADPKKFIDIYKERITSVHVKDIAPAGANVDEGGWADVGYGTVDWKSLFVACKATKAKHFIVEHDNPSDLVRLATRSIKTINAF